MEKEKNISKMVIYTKVNLKMINLTEMVLLLIQMGINMLASLLMIISKEGD